MAVLDYEVPGLADAIRRSGLPKVPTSVLSRGVCGVAGRTLVVNLPGSPGGVRDRARSARRRAGPRAGPNRRQRPPAMRPVLRAVPD